MSDYVDRLGEDDPFGKRRKPGGGARDPWDWEAVKGDGRLDGEGELRFEVLSMDR